MLPDYSIIGKRIKKYRHIAHLTQEELADKLDVSVAFISRIERGASHLNLNRLTQISEILGVSPSEILSGSNTESKYYLYEEFSEILSQCNTKQQKLIYQLSELVAKTKMD